MIAVDISPARDDETAWVLSAWKRSFRSAPGNALRSSEGYYRWANPTINELAQRISVTVARDAERPEVGYAWVAWVVPPGTRDLVVHYAYTVWGFRRQGLAGRVLGDILTRTNPDDLIYTARTRFDRRVEALGFRFVPLSAYTD